MATVVIAGVSGCIGSWVAHHLVEDGHRVIGVDLSPRTPVLDLLGSRDQIEFQQLDVTDSQGYMELLERSNADGVVHLASLLMPTCKKNPELCVDVNVKSFQVVLDAARKQGFNVAYASSAWVLNAAPSDVLLTEEALPAPQSLYGVFKLTNEWMSRTYANDYGVVSNGLRPYIVYGPGREVGLTADVNLALLAAAKGQPYTIGFGGQVALHHASDVARTFVRLALKPAAAGRVYNVRGTVTHMSDVVAAIERVTDTTGLIDFDDKSLPIGANLSDDALQRDYGPVRYFGLEEGMRRTLDTYGAA